MMATVKKATHEERLEYEKTNPVYTLYGFVKIGQHLCEIEWPNEPDGPKYEVMAPRGYIFNPEGVHTLLCFSLTDLQVRVSGNELEKCHCAGGCKEYWEKFA